MRHRFIIILIFILVFIGLQFLRIREGFIWEYEAGFQEMIALHHLGSGVIRNHFLPVIAEVEGDRYYHTAHPPLLHIIYYFLYRFCGVKEYVTRIFSMVLLLGSIFLFGQLVSEGKRVIFWLISLFNPISFRLGLLTNYEPLAIFSISLFLYFFERSGSDFFLKRLLKVGVCLLLIVLSDWTSYLAVPVLLLVHIRSARERRWILWVFVAEAILFLGLIIYMRAVAGELSLIYHSGVRSNPVYLFEKGTYLEFFEHLKWITGLPFLVLFLFSGLRLILRSGGRNFERLIIFSGCFFILLWLLAGNLVSRHIVYLLYLFPLVSAVLAEAVSGISRRWVALFIVLASFIIPDYTGLRSKDARYYYLAKALKERIKEGIRIEDLNCFSSVALGTLNFYDKIETVVPVSRRATESIKKRSYDILILDRVSPEVKDLIGLVNYDDYELIWSFPDIFVYMRRGLNRGGEYTGAGLEQELVSEWWEPRAEVIFFKGSAYYGLRQPSGADGISRIYFRSNGRYFCFAPMIYRGLFSGRSDGVGFMVTGDEGSRRRLSYFRFISGDSAGFMRIDISGLSGINLIIESGPRGDYSYDDAYWLEARSADECRGGLNGR